MTLIGSKRRPAEHLGLQGDGDELDVIVGVERAFGVHFPAIENVWTVGDLFAALLRTFPASEEPGRCASAMAFYRLRKALTKHGMQGVVPSARLAPATSLAELLERTGMSAPALRDNLAYETGLDLPPLAFSRVGTIGAALVICGFFGLFLTPVFGIDWRIPLGLGLAGGWMVYLDPRRFEEKTLGDLARAVATRNAARLIDAGADGRESALWRAFVAVIREETANVEGEIARETALIDPAFRARQAAGHS